jgi:serine/threonine protein kinase
VNASQLDPMSLRDQAYEEYLALLEGGERVDLLEFCDRYPACRSALFRLLSLHQEISRLPEAIPTPEFLWPQPGNALGDLTLLRELGRGSFARVFLATEASAGDRPVVVKVSFGGQAEAHTLGRLTHRNIVPILWGRHDPATALTLVCMPYLGSATLEHVLQHVGRTNRGGRGARDTVSPPAPPLSPPASLLLEAASSIARPGDPPLDSGAPHPRLRRGSFVAGVLQVGLELAEALAFLHQRGISHCDLKPSNVLLSPDGCPRLLDFNLAIESTGQSPRGGSLPYAAPEQIRTYLRLAGEDGPLSPASCQRSDLFSLGVILHELLTGVHPFGPVPPALPPEELAALMLERHRRGSRPLAEAIHERLSRPDLDRPVLRLLERCLAFDPDERPATAAKLADGLRAYFQPLRGLRRLAVRRRLVLSIGCGVALAAAAVGAALWPGSPQVPGGTGMAETRSASAGTLHELGRAAYREGRYREAESHFNALLSTDPLDTRARFALGWIRLKQSAVAANEAQRSALLAAAQTDLGPRTLENPRQPLAHVSLAYCFALRGEHTRAIHHLELAEKAGLCSTTVLNNRAVSLRLRSAPREAEHDLLRISPEDRNLPEVAYNRAALALRRRLQHSPPGQPGNTVPPEALEDARCAADGSDHVTAHWLAARLFGLADEDVLRRAKDAPRTGRAGPASAPAVPPPDPVQREAHLQQALLHLRRSLELGLDPRFLDTDPVCISLHSHPAFRGLREVRQLHPMPPPAFFGLIEPVPDLGD